MNLHQEECLTFAFMYFLQTMMVLLLFFLESLVPTETVNIKGYNIMNNIFASKQMQNLTVEIHVYRNCNTQLQHLCVFWYALLYSLLTH